MATALITDARPVSRFLVTLIVALLLFPQTVPAEDAGEEDHADEWRINFVPYFWAPDVKADVRVKDQTFDFDADFEGFDKGKYDPRASGLYFEMFKDDWGGIVRLEFREAETDIPELQIQELEVSTIVVDVLAAHESILTLKGTKITLIPWVGFRYRDHDQFLRFKDGTEVNAGDYSFEPVIGARLEWQLNKWLALGTMVDASGFGVGDGPEKHNVVLGEVKVLLSKEFSLALGYRYDDFEVDRGEYSFDGTMEGPYVALALDFWGKAVPAVAAWDGGLSIAGGDVPDLPDDILPDLDLTEEQKRNFLLRWLDNSHDYVNRKVDTGAGSVDELLTKGDVAMMERERARVAIALYTEVAEDDGVKWKFRPRYEGDIPLPNLERNVRARISSKAVDEIEGADPLEIYGEHAMAAVQRLDEVEHVGDIAVVSPYDPETGEVLAFEELVGIHGGLGGVQTEPYILYPSEWELDLAPLLGAPMVYQQLRRWMEDELGMRFGKPASPESTESNEAGRS